MLALAQHHMGGMHWGWWVFWAAVLVLALWLILRGRMPPKTTPRSDESPLEMLERLYAAGEISSEEFEERRARLQQGKGL